MKYVIYERLMQEFLHLNLQEAAEAFQGLEYIEMEHKPHEWREGCMYRIGYTLVICYEGKVLEYDVKELIN